MTTGELLGDLRARGLRLRCEEGKLLVAPRTRLADGDRAALTAHKPALVALLDDLEQLERDGTATKLRAIAATLTPPELERLRAEAASGDRLAELVTAVLATTEALRMPVFAHTSGRGAPQCPRQGNWVR